MKEEENTPLFNYDQYFNGEIDEFLKDTNQTSLLIHGLAGSGKSITARKIEEYLWIQYSKQSNNQSWNQQMNLVIPIFIQLPLLKEPLFSAIEETLQSQIYNFDQKQVNQFLDFVQNSQIKLIFILDSYDELANQYIGKNLIQSNKIYQWKHKNDLKNPKVITTTRTEIFTNTSYREWFWESNMTGSKNFKEIRLQPFNSSQREEFLNQFGQLQLKLQIKDLLESNSKKQSQDIIIQDTLQIYDQLQIGNSFQKEYLLNQTIKKLIQIIKSHPNVININSDQEISFNKQLQIIWSVDQYQQSIKQMEIDDLLDTPFMLNIVVQVLPQMSDTLSSQNYIKEYFKDSFVIEKRNQIQSIINRYQSKNTFITQLYTQQEINELQEFINNKNNKILITESTNIWNRLIESNFIKDFTIMLQYENIIKLLDQLNLKEKITIKERDIDNKAMTYKALTSKKFTIYEFYQFFFNNYTEKQRMKLIYNNDIKDLNQFQIDIQNYVVQFAVTMTINNKTTIEMKPKGILFRGQQETSPFEKFFEDLDQHANYRNLIRKCLPLKQKANFYSFNHKTIQEYLFAKDIIDFLMSIDLSIDQLLYLRNKQGAELQNGILKLNAKIKQYEDCTLNQINLGTSALLGAFKFIKVAIKQNDELQEVCYKLSLLSSVFNQLLRLSSNSFYIYINVKSVIKNKDFSRMHIGDISINYATFKKCNFSDSIFKRVEIYGINFSNIDLSRIDWQDIYTNELPTYISNQNFEYISFSYDCRQIIGGDNQGMLHIWDKQSSQLIKQFKIDNKILYINQFQDKALISLSKIITITDELNIFGEHITIKQFLIKVWDGEYNLLNQLSIHEFQNDACSLFTHNNVFIGIILQQNTIKVTKINDFKLYKQRGFKKDLVKIQIMADQNIIYAITYKDWVIIKWNFDSDTEQEIQTNILQPDINENLDWESIFSLDCNLLIVKFDKQKQNLKVFSLLDRQLQELRFQHDIIKFILSQDNKYLVLSDWVELYAYDIYSQSRLFFLKAGKQIISDIKFNSDSTELITAQQHVKLWDVELLKEKQNQHEEFHKIQEAQTSPDNLLIYYYNYKNNNGAALGLFVADIKTGEQLERINIFFLEFMICLSVRYIYFIDLKENLLKYDVNAKKFDNLYNFSNKNNLRIINISQSYDYRLLKIAQVGFDNYVNVILLNEDATKIQGFKNINIFNIQFTHDRMSFYYMGNKKTNIQKCQIKYQESEENFLQELDEPNLLPNDYLKWFLITQDDVFIIALNYENMLYKLNISKLEKVQILDININNFKIFNQYLMVWYIQSEYLWFYDLKSLQLMSKQYINDKVFFYENNKIMISVEKNQFVKIWKFNKKIENYKNQAFNLALMMPKNRNDEVVLHNLKWDNSKIQSHLNFDLITLWTQKTQNIE